MDVENNLKGYISTQRSLSNRINNVLVKQHHINIMPSVFEADFDSDVNTIPTTCCAYYTITSFSNLLAHLILMIVNFIALIRIIYPNFYQVIHDPVRFLESKPTILEYVLLFAISLIFVISSLIRGLCLPRCCGESAIIQNIITFVTIVSTIASSSYSSLTAQ